MIAAKRLAGGSDMIAANRQPLAPVSAQLPNQRWTLAPATPTTPVLEEHNGATFPSDALVDQYVYGWWPHESSSTASFSRLSIECRQIICAKASAEA